MPASLDQFLPPLPAAFEPFSEVLSDLVLFVLVTVAVYAVGRLLVVPFVLRVVRSRNRNNPTLVTATETYLAVGLVGLAIFAGLVVTGQAGFLITTDSALLVAALTFVFGVAGQEVFGSLISGLFLVADPDFNVGDYISWPGGEGVVEAVDFRVSRIRTPDNETITVPNTELTTNALTRPFGRERYRVTERVFVDYAEDTERSLMELRAVATNLEAVATDPSPTTRILDLGADNVTIRAEFYVADPDGAAVLDVRSMFRRRVKERFDEAGITLAPPSAQELEGRLTVTRGGRSDG